MNVSLDLELKARNTFQNRIADVFNPDNERFKSIELKQLELECEKVLDKHEISLENRLFYSESLKMIKSSLFTIDTIDVSPKQSAEMTPEKQNDLNNKVISYFDNVVDYSESVREKAGIYSSPLPTSRNYSARELPSSMPISKTKNDDVFTKRTSMDKAKNDLFSNLPKSIERQIKDKIEFVHQSVIDSTNRIKSSVQRVPYKSTYFPAMKQMFGNDSSYLPSSRNQSKKGGIRYIDGAAPFVFRKPVPAVMDAGYDLESDDESNVTFSSSGRRTFDDDMTGFTAFTGFDSGNSAHNQIGKRSPQDMGENWMYGPGLNGSNTLEETFNHTVPYETVYGESSVFSSGLQVERPVRNGLIQRQDHQSGHSNPTSDGTDIAIDRRSSTSQFAFDDNVTIRRGKKKADTVLTVTGEGVAKETVTLMNQWNDFKNSAAGLKANFGRHIKNVLFDKFYQLEAERVGDVFTEARIVGDGDCGFWATNWTRQDALDLFRENSKNSEVREKMAPEIAGVLLDHNSDKGLRSLLARKTGYNRVIHASVRIGEDMNDLASAVKERLLELGGDDGRVRNIESIAAINKQFLEKLNLKDISEKDINQILKAAVKFRELTTSYDKLFTDFDMNTATSREDVYLAYVNNFYGKGGYLAVPDKSANGDKATSGAISILAEARNTPVRVWKKDPEDPNNVFLQYQTGDITKGNRMNTLDIIHGGIHFNKLVPNQGGLARNLTSTIEDWKKTAGRADIFTVPFRAMKKTLMLTNGPDKNPVVKERPSLKRQPDPTVEKVATKKNSPTGVPTVPEAGSATNISDKSEKEFSAQKKQSNMFMRVYNRFVRL
ncbi:hypothetical protein HOG98_03285 [bacterium]|jgi:hypothetical protein|nr:hypothetical protein [bacterium]